MAVEGGATKMEKAYLTITTPSGTSTQFGFKYNPNEYTYAKSASWRRTPAAGAAQAGVPEFIGSDPRSMVVEIFLDETDSASASVSADLETLFSCMAPTAESVSSGKPSPPSVVFGWGSTVSFKAFVRHIEAQVTLFRADGTPSRATCTVTLEEIPTNTPRQNPTSGALATFRTHLVVAGDTMASIAYRAYGRPDQWRAIADANGIDDPTRVLPGTTLLVPPKEEAARWA